MSQINRELITSEIQKKYKHLNFFKVLFFTFLAATSAASYMIWHYYSYGQWTMDGALQNFAKALRTPWLDMMFRGITAMGETLPVVVVTLVIVAALAFRKKYFESAVLAVHMLGVWQLNERLKMLFQRPRPDASLHLVEISHYNLANSFSLPSGHSMNFMALMLISIYLLWFFSKKTKLNVMFTIFLLVFGLLTGISRVYLNVHYFSDVVTGWSISIAYTSIMVMIHSVIRRKQKIGSI